MLGTYDYPTSHRVFEFVSVATFVGFAGALTWRVVGEVSDRASLAAALAVIALVLAAYAVADLASGVVHFLLDSHEHPYHGVFIIGLVAGVIMTNQLHKWAHMPTVPRAVAFAQRRGIVLSKQHHSVHHSGGYDRNYCITWGHLDVVLNRLVHRRAVHPSGEQGRDLGGDEVEVLEVRQIEDLQVDALGAGVDEGADRVGGFCGRAGSTDTA